MKILKRGTIAAIVWITICLSTSLAFSQQPDPAFLQAAISAIRVQRDAANDAAAIAEAKLSLATAELEKARARIKELEPKPVEK